MTWQKLPKPSTLWEEGEKWFELEDNLTEGKFDFLEYKEEPLPRGIILQRDVSVAMGPETLGIPGDLSRIWVAFTDQETGEIYLARSDKDWNQWEEYLQVIYAPSGSYQPSLTFGQDGWYRMAVTLIPAGEEIPEVWIIQPPYAGDGIRRIALGEMPLLLRDWHGRHFVFYKAPGGNIEYRNGDDEYGTATIFTYASGEDVPIGARTPIYPINDPYHIQFQNVLFYGDPLTTPKYALTAIEDFYTVGITFVVMHKRLPLSNVCVRFNNETVTTDSDGTATFLRVPWGVTLPYSFTHPMLGEGASASFDVLPSFRGTHLRREFEFSAGGLETAHAKVVLRTEWRPTEYVEYRPVDETVTVVNVSIEWYQPGIGLEFTALKGGTFWEDGEILPGAIIHFDGVDYTCDENGKVMLFIPPPLEHFRIYDYEITHASIGSVRGKLQLDFSTEKLVNEVNYTTSLLTPATIRMRLMQSNLAFIYSNNPVKRFYLQIVNTTLSQQITTSKTVNETSSSVSVVIRPATRCTTCGLSTCNRSNNHSPRYRIYDFTLGDLKSLLSPEGGALFTDPTAGLVDASTHSSTTINYSQHSSMTTTVDGEIKSNWPEAELPITLARQKVIPLTTFDLDSVYFNAVPLTNITDLQNNEIATFTLELRGGSGGPGSVIAEGEFVEFHNYSGRMLFDFPEGIVLEKGTPYWLVIKTRVGFLSGLIVRGRNQTASSRLTPVNSTPYPTGLDESSYVGTFWMSDEVPEMAYSYKGEKTSFSRMFDKETQLASLSFGIIRKEPESIEVPLWGDNELDPYPIAHKVNALTEFDINWQEIEYLVGAVTTEATADARIASILWVEVEEI